MMDFQTLPQQMLSFSQKNKKWRKQHLDWADKKTYYFGNTVRNSILRKRTNYALVNGHLDMQDLEIILNPGSSNALYVPDKIQHYSIMNAKLNVLRGEEAKRRFDYHVIVTNPNSVSEVEEHKRELLTNKLIEMITDPNQSEEEFNAELDKISYYFDYTWKDIIEIQATELLNHYTKELSIFKKFNDGFMDALIAGEEMYQCDIVGGEPTIERLNPLKVHIFKNGFSSKIEDADLIILIDYWSPGKILDTYYDVLSAKDIKEIDQLVGKSTSDSMDNVDERNSFINISELDGSDLTGGEVIENFAFFGQSGLVATSNYYDNQGNIRILRVYWKSKRKIKKVKYYNPETGEEQFDFFSEDYIINESLGEEETIFWVNEAWEGTKIGRDIYVNMRPRVVQYNRLSNPSRCHFGIIGSIYNLNDSKPFSLVDMMKPYAYLYDVIQARLNEAIAANWGKMVKLDLALVPKEWEIEKWLYHAKINHIAVVDSFKEGNGGAAQGKLAGALNNQTSGVIDAEQGNYIQEHINLLEYIKQEMGEIAGISRQREGQISNRETVGGVERATLQSSHITEWLFTQHDDVKKRALECFVETAKVAMRGKSKKFQYITDEGARKVLTIDGTDFADSDYGIVVDSSPETQEQMQRLQSAAMNALQANLISFSTMLKIANSASMAEIRRSIERDERQMKESQTQTAQQTQELQMQQLQAQADLEQQRLQVEENKNIRDNETKIYLEQLKQSTQENNSANPQNNDDEKLEENRRQFDESLSFDKNKLDQEIKLKKEELDLKRTALKQPKTNTK